jgi:hypothetical protein
MLDRIDIHIEVPCVDYEKLSGDRMGEDRRVDSQVCAGGTHYSTTSFGRFVFRYRRNADMRALTSLCWLLRSSAGKKRIIMVLPS